MACYRVRATTSHQRPTTNDPLLNTTSYRHLLLTFCFRVLSYYKKHSTTRRPQLTESYDYVRLPTTTYFYLLLRPITIYNELLRLTSNYCLQTVTNYCFYYFSHEHRYTYLRCTAHDLRLPTTTSRHSGQLTTYSLYLPLLLASTYHVLATSTTYNLLIAYFLSFFPLLTHPPTFLPLATYCVQRNTHNFGTVCFTSNCCVLEGSTFTFDENQQLSPVFFFFEKHTSKEDPNIITS